MSQTKSSWHPHDSGTVRHRSLQFGETWRCLCYGFKKSNRGNKWGRRRNQQAVMMCFPLLVPLPQANDTAVTRIIHCICLSMSEWYLQIRWTWPDLAAFCFLLKFRQQHEWCPRAMVLFVCPRINSVRLWRRNLFLHASFLATYFFLCRDHVFQGPSIRRLHKGGA